MKLHSGDGGDDEIGRARREDAGEERVAPLAAPAADYVGPARGGGEKARDILRVVLPVGVERDYPFAAGRRYAGCQRRGLPVVLRKPQGLVPGLGRELRQLPEGTVRAAVVDPDDLVRQLHSRQRGAKLGLETGEAFPLVENGDHGGEHGVHKAPFFASSSAYRSSCCRTM